MSDIVKEIDEFIDIYITGSTIKNICYRTETKNWQILFKDKTILTFESFKEMLEWLNKDQFGL